MKVSNKNIAGTAAPMDNAKLGKADGTQGLKKDVRAGGGLGTKDIAGGAKVDVSERAQMMQKAKDIASNTTVDESKVARLQKMIDEGTYKVDSDKIADRLVDEHMLIPD